MKQKNNNILICKKLENKKNKIILEDLNIINNLLEQINNDLKIIKNQVKNIKKDYDDKKNK